MRTSRSAVHQGLEEVWSILPDSVLCGLLSSQILAYLLSLEEKKGANACLKFG